MVAFAGGYFAEDEAREEAGHDDDSERLFYLVLLLLSGSTKPQSFSPTEKKSPKSITSGFSAASVRRRPKGRSRFWLRSVRPDNAEWIKLPNRDSLYAYRWLRVLGPRG